MMSLVGKGLKGHGHDFTAYVRESDGQRLHFSQSSDNRLVSVTCM